MIKPYVFLLIVMMTQNLFSQIKVAPVNPLWTRKIDSALSIVKKYDSDYYDTIIKYCKSIGFWRGNFSTVENNIEEITISVNEINNSCINNIAAILVHESTHLYFIKNKRNYPIEYEEMLCYQTEKYFLKKIPNVETFLLENVEYQIKQFERD